VGGAVEPKTNILPKTSYNNILIKIQIAVWRILTNKEIYAIAKKSFHNRDNKAT
jgi:hypothetical protein